MRVFARIARTVIVSALGLAVAMSIAPAASATEVVDLTMGMWDVRGADHARSWDTSTLTFTNQVWNGTEWALEGYFDWSSSDGRFGREMFTGSLDNDFNLFIQGLSIVEPTNGGVGTSTYQAQLVVDGDSASIVDGVWPAPGQSSAVGSWSAFQVVPAPGAIALLCAAGLVGRRRRRAH